MSLFFNEAEAEAVYHGHIQTINGLREINAKLMATNKQLSMALSEIASFEGQLPHWSSGFKFREIARKALESNESS